MSERATRGGRGPRRRPTHLTVMGMDGLLSLSLSCSLAPLLITTYRFFSFSAAAAERRGPHFLHTHTHTHDSARGGADVTADRADARRYSRSGVGDVLLEARQRNLALDALGLGLSAEVDVHHVSSQSLRTRDTHVNDDSGAAAPPPSAPLLTMSLCWSCWSLMMKIMSNRDRMVGMKSMLSSPLVSSQRPNTELAAARTEQRELSVVVMPA